MPADEESELSQTHRRLIVVMHADAAGFTRQSERDEEWTFKTLRDYRDVFSSRIAEHRGQTREIRGDGILAEFSSTVDAVLAAGAIQSELGRRNQAQPRHRRLNFRIGIHVGEAVTGENEIFGDVINVAARVQKHTPPGEVCISSLVRSLIGERLPLLRYKAHMDQRVRNHADSVDIYRVVWLEPKSSPAGESLKTGPWSQLERRPSVGVLVFEDHTKNRAHQFIGESLTEDTIAQLSRFRTISVLGCPLARHEGGADSLSHIASENGVQYVVRGSIVETDSRLRIFVQLIDGDTEKTIWGDQYHESAEHVFDRQRDVVHRAVSTLARRIAEDRHYRGETIGQNALKAWDLCDRGDDLSYVWKAEDDRQALEYFLRAIELDSSYARAHAGAAAIYHSRNLISPGNPTNEEDLKKAGWHAKEAIRLDPLDSRNHVYLGWWYLLNRRFERGEHHFERAGELNPHDATTLIARAQACAYLGRGEDALRLARQALDLVPYQPDDYYHVYLATVYFAVRDYDRTLGAVAAARDLLPEVGAWRVAANVHLGRIQDGEAAAQEFVSHVRARWAGPSSPDPQQIVDWLDEIIMFKNSSDREHLFGPLSKVGLPRPRANGARREA
ncbi:MAG TPA: adenylate/guanylate cyclase domain-containing protein [Candidatus Acidoferrum sp.]|nr:adenylate/guanylate cyclase domain-containing protein [Candidatus Acidoferrum sp.]